MATYYVDSDNGNDANPGTSPGSAYKSIDPFISAALNPGDNCLVRNGRTAKINVFDTVSFAADGTGANPILLEMDYDDSWGDHLISSRTFTVTFGSKTLVGSGTVTDVAVGDWVYLAGDDKRKYAYEVSSVSGVNVGLIFPYKGDQSGSNITLNNMGFLSKLGNTGDNIQLATTNVLFWKIRGLHIRSQQSAAINLAGISIIEFSDIVVEQDTVPAIGIFIGNRLESYFNKSRFFGYDTNAISTVSILVAYATFKDCRFDATPFPNANVISAGGDVHVFFDECEFTGHTKEFNYDDTFANPRLRVKCRNCIFASVAPVENVVPTNEPTGYDNTFHSEDHGGFGSMAVVDWRSKDDASPTMITSGLSPRAGGGTPIQVLPSTIISSNFRNYRIELFNYQIYNEAEQRVYTAYVKPQLTSNWVLNPTFNELYLEAEYIGHTSNRSRKFVQSASLVDFANDSNWQVIQVVVNPPIAGTMYLRLYYSKTKESGINNAFFFDPKIEIT